MTIESQDTDTQQQSLLGSDRTEENYDATTNGDKENGPHEVKEAPHLPLFNIVCILSTAFSYGCIMTTLFLITLPVECERIEKQHPNIPKSVALGIFVAIAGLTQLISPMIGMLSDTYHPPAHHELGQRMPYLCLGAILCVAGLLGQYIESYEKLWLRYGLFFFCHMIGLNIIYGMMLALIPDQVPRSQTGTSNGVLAFLLVTGSLFGFGLFHGFFGTDIQDMYGLYICIVTFTTILTGSYAHDRDAQLNSERIRMHVDTYGPRRGILTPWLLLRTMLYDPIRDLDSQTLFTAYSIDRTKYHDFYVVTVSRLWYYCGISVQTFFLYFLHDIIHVKDDPESAVAYLAILAQISGSFICYPIGVASDQLFGGRRKPFVYLACAILGGLTVTMIFATTMHHMEILCSILGAANGIYLTMETSMAVDTLPVDYDDGPSGGNAQLLGIWGVAAFLGSALGPMVGGPLLYFFGSPDGIVDEDQGYTIRGYAVILSLSCVYFFMSAVTLRWVRNKDV